MATNEHPNRVWYLNSGATSHLTNDINNLTLGDPVTYKATDNISIGDGNTLPIAHTCVGLLPTPSYKLHLPQLLHIPTLSHNLILIYHLTKDNNLSISFVASGFTIKDSRTNKLLLKGPCCNGLYPIPQQPQSTTSTTFIATTRHQVATICQNRLGHPHTKTMTTISTTYKLLNIPTLQFLCSSCKVSKVHRIQFSRSQSRSSLPLELIHFDV